MIKKLLGFFIIGLGLVNITFGYAYINQVGSNVYPQTNSTIANVDSLLNILRIPNGTETEYNFTYFGTVGVIGRKGNRLYSYDYYKTTNKETQGYINNIYECTYNTVSSSNKLALNDNISHCEIVGNISSLQNYVGHINYYAVGTMGMGNSYYATVLCFIEEDPTEISSTHHWYCLYPDTSDSEGYDWKSYSIDLINSLNIFNSSPLTSSGGGGDGDQEIVGIELGSDESAINYFENRYGRSESICYAGIDNVTTNWGTSVSFQEGTGLNIFQVFSGINNMSPDPNKVYVRLNSRLINYEQWFGRSGDPLYLSNYNTGTNQVDLYYDNLSFPFANNPVAVYFLSSNITVHSEYSTMGSEIVSYCNIKINSGSFDDIIDQSTKNNITKYTKQENKNGGLNPDGTQKPNVNLGGSDFGSGMWGGTGSWSDVEFTGDVDLKSFFDNAIENMQNAIDISDINPFTGVLPNYLIFAFLLVVLFKVLRH